MEGIHSSENIQAKALQQLLLQMQSEIKLMRMHHRAKFCLSGYNLDERIEFPGIWRVYLSPL